MYIVDISKARISKNRLNRHCKCAYVRVMCVCTHGCLSPCGVQIMMLHGNMMHACSITLIFMIIYDVGI